MTIIRTIGPSSASTSPFNVTTYNHTAGDRPGFGICSICGESVEITNLSKFQISSNNTAASNNFTQVFFYCKDCMRWLRRKRWIRLLDNQKHYGKY